MFGEEFRSQFGSKAIGIGFAGGDFLLQHGSHESAVVCGSLSSIGLATAGISAGNIETSNGVGNLARLCVPSVEIGQNHDGQFVVDVSSAMCVVNPCQAPLCSISLWPLVSLMLQAKP